ncbi:hypothetical protein CBR_g6349 [Chara braunii]|uniref:Hexosyltransferase n=1 Tax=Chara braunii TaxID=69332 RepID=A0A388KJK6_CHABU|nr:hypothetical protein CBR_g6349 [Chara braunii]|eukprot:GBG70217.1 hypothetical protein CBR_g6349 [Chara braunii]
MDGSSGCGTPIASRRAMASSRRGSLSRCSGGSWATLMACLTLAVVHFVATTLHLIPPPDPLPDPNAIHVFVTTDEKDLRPLVVLLNSTFVNSKNADKLAFHIFMPEDREASTREQLRFVLPNVRFDVNRFDVDIENIKRHIAVRNTSVERDERCFRKELRSPYNFVPFYLPQVVKGIKRMIYLDLDIVVQGDVTELADLDMQGYPAAVVEDCMQTMANYFDFKQLRHIQSSYKGNGDNGENEGENETGGVRLERPSWLPPEVIDSKTCVSNRGVLMVDVDQWIGQNITAAIEWWIAQFNVSAADRPLYRCGMSQPPFLLSLYKNYKKLDLKWNVRGLGRVEFAEGERDYYQEQGYLRPDKRPFISPFSEKAKALHFNGPLKPWKQNRTFEGPGLERNGTEPWPLEPQWDPSISIEEQRALKLPSLCGQRLILCSAIWWRYLSPEADNLFNPKKKSARKVTKVVTDGQETARTLFNQVQTQRLRRRTRLRAL